MDKSYTLVGDNKSFQVRSIFLKDNIIIGEKCMIFKAMNLEKEIPRCTTVDIQTQTNIPELRFNKIYVIQQK